MVSYWEKMLPLVKPLVNLLYQSEIMYLKMSHTLWKHLNKKYFHSVNYKYLIKLHLK